jgi:hypothetical protein
MRNYFTLSDVVLILSHYLPDIWKRLQLPCQPTAITEVVEVKLHCTHVRATEIMEFAETQLFLYNLLLMKLIDDGDYKNVTYIYCKPYVGQGIL